MPAIELLRLFFHMAREEARDDTSRPRWLHYSLVACYYILPTLLVVFFFISLKVTAIVAGIFMISMVVGIMAEEDDLGD
ncbi:MAG TPA: hypothetical protein VNH65_20365 [Candidatus Acidoferrum sp.]|nr:hypothetical protein [Candidatus Acidoferrum sp.]